MKAWLTKVHAMTAGLWKLRPSPWLARRLAVVVAVVAVGIGAFCWGRHNALSPSANADSSPDGTHQAVVAINTDQSVLATRRAQIAISRLLELAYCS